VYSWINIYRGWTNNGNTRQYWNKALCWQHWKNISCVFCYSFDCFFLCSTSVSALQIVFCNSLYDSNAKCETSHIFKQDKLLVRFSWSICNQNGHFIRCITRAAVSKVMMTYTNNGRTSSAKKNSGWKPKLSERYRHTLKRIVSESSFTWFPILGRICVRTSLKKPIILNAWFQLWNMEPDLW
jgi:hypothetical protein